MRDLSLFLIKLVPEPFNYQKTIRSFIFEVVYEFTHCFLPNTPIPTLNQFNPQGQTPSSLHFLATLAKIKQSRVVIPQLQQMDIKQIQLITKAKLDKSGYKENLNQTIQQMSAPSMLPKQRLMELEGQCKIDTFRALKIAWIKAIILFIPIVGSGIGLLLLKYFKSLRAAVFYSECDYSEAEYFYIKSKDKHEDIETAHRADQNLFVYFKKLKYKLVGSQLCPVGYEFQELYESIRSRDYIQRGVTQTNRIKKIQSFGPNEHRVQIPNYFEFMFDVLSKPFFLLQYAICIMQIFQRIYIFVYMYLGFSFTTTSINYILLYTSYTRIKEIAEKQYNVRVIRDGQESVVLSHSLVPGDVVIPQKDDQMTFDGLLMSGEVFVNEASLTGESIPIGKFPSQDLNSAKKENTWLFQGSKVLESRSNSRVVVINTGYGTRRGRIIRKILTRVSKKPEFYHKALIFLVVNLAAGSILYFATLYLMVGNIIDTFVGFRFLDVVSWTFPPAFPIFFNLAYTYSLVRLKYRRIFGTQPQKTTESAYIRTFCFDKTGTLTQNEIQVYEIAKFKSDSVHENITKGVEDPSNSIIFKLFASCHAVREIQGSHLGDEVDLRMYLHSGYKMSVPSSGDIRFVVQNKQGERLQVLRINQFESKFQNMSVLVRDAKQDKFYVFIKGAPERIDRDSILKFKNFEHLVASFSLGGYRTIAYAYKQIPKSALKTYLSGERQIFEKDITALGLVAFENKLKEDTRQTIDRLILSDIEPKMITGDNIYIAVETGYRAGILRPGEKVLLLQGRKQQSSISALKTYKGITIEKRDDEILKHSVQLSQEEYLNQSTYALAIDNDFLMMTPEPTLTRQIKLFARTSPENKARIVKKFIEYEQQQFNSRSRSDKIFGTCRWKVGMCGDGANDLMAIRQADIGVGISDSDASYGASFNVADMLDVQYIVRQSKNTSQAIVDIIIYFASIYFLRNITAILMVTEVTNLGPMALIYLNFAHSLWLVSFIAVSSTADEATSKRPIINMLSMRNTVVYWSNVIFPSAGIIAGFYYFKSTDIFVPNAKRTVTFQKGYIGLYCQTQALMFLMVNLPYIFNAFVTYTSEPYKSKIYKNIPLFVTIVGNAAAAVVIFFYIGQFPQLFYFVSLPYFESGMVLVIMCASIILGYAFQGLFKKMNAYD